jgi:hypothetical protein
MHTVIFIHNDKTYTQINSWLAENIKEHLWEVDDTSVVGGIEVKFEQEKHLTLFSLAFSQCRQFKNDNHLKMWRREMFKKVAYASNTVVSMRRGSV